MAQCAVHCLHTGVAGLPSGAAVCCWCNEPFGGVATLQALPSGAQAYRTGKHTANYGPGSSAGTFWSQIRSNGGKD